MVGFTPDEVSTSTPTRAARLKWVIVVDRTIPTGRIANAIACVAASTGEAVSGMIGPTVPDATGQVHTGLPWAGCTILAAEPHELVEIHAKAAASPDVFVADMPAFAQTTRVYDEYMATLAETKPDDLAVCAISVVGPRNRVSKLVKRLELMP
ncbi:hypothetical protein GCM10029964_040860 [Kibdelosporangium lantanae]